MEADAAKSSPDTGSLPETLAWSDDTNSNNALVWVATAIVAAFVIHKAFFRRDKSADVPIPTEGMAESRLLRQKFGVIPDINDHTSTGSSHEELNKELKEEYSGQPVLEPELDLDTVSASASTPTVEVPIKVATAEDADKGAAEPIASSEASTGTVVVASPKITRAQRLRERLALAANTRVEQNRPRFQADSDAHPGLTAFWHWCDVETSLFRVYTITRKDNVIDNTTIAPYNPSSRRGNVRINLIVTNHMTNVIVKVFWIDYKGKHISKGTISPNGGTWQQSTWIDHPWIFCEADPTSTTGEDRIMLHYIPYKAIPDNLREGQEGTTHTVDAENEEGDVGLHRFSIVSSTPESMYSCNVVDSIFPHPASAHIVTPHKAVEFALLHCNRMSYHRWSVLKKYVNNILVHPENPLCRQIRTSNPVFAESVWNTPAKGVLLAAGFIEHGAYVEFGSADPVSSDTAQELSLLLYAIELWERRAT